MLLFFFRCFSFFFCFFLFFVLAFCVCFYLCFRCLRKETRTASLLLLFSVHCVFIFLLFFLVIPYYCVYVCWFCSIASSLCILNTRKKNNAHFSFIFFFSTLVYLNLLLCVHHQIRYLFFSF